MNSLSSQFITPVVRGCKFECNGGNLPREKVGSGEHFSLAFLIAVLTANNSSALRAANNNWSYPELPAVFSPTADAYPYLMNSTEETDAPEKEMNFLDHIEELRSRALKSILWILAGCAVAGYFREWIMNEALLKPAIDAKVTLQNLEPFGQAFLLFKVILFSGIVISFPFVMHQVWSFVAPGLYAHERKWARWVTAITTLCFLFGVAFGYWVLIPSMMNYINVVANPNIEDNISTSNYFSFFINMLLASGLIFELPMVTFVLAKIGLVTSNVMSRYRRHAIVVILIVAALITPTPDPITQLMVAIPLYILYEISVVIAKLTSARQAKEDDNQGTD